MHRTLRYFSAAEHPRSRGDELRAAADDALLAGTPPLAWGRDGRDAGLPDTDRNAPARVGTSPERRCAQSAPPEHPRSRGDEAPRNRVVDAEEARQGFGALGV